MKLFVDRETLIFDSLSSFPCQFSQDVVIPSRFCWWFHFHWL